MHEEFTCSSVVMSYAGLIVPGMRKESVLCVALSAREKGIFSTKMIGYFLALMLRSVCLALCYTIGGKCYTIKCV